MCNGFEKVSIFIAGGDSWYDLCHQCRKSTYLPSRGLTDGRPFELCEHSCDSGKERMLFVKGRERCYL